MAIAGVAAVVLVLTAAAQGAADPMGGRYGNTQRIDQADGRVIRAMFNPDKTVTLMRPDGSVMQGTWALEADQLCLSMSMMVIDMKRCMPFVPNKKAGDSWKQKGPDGDEVKVTIVPGRN